MTSSVQDFKDAFLAGLRAREHKVRENLVRRRLARRGLMLRKSRRRDPHACDYGMLWVVDPERNCLVFGHRSQQPITLVDIEAWLDDA
ncbi:MAG: hypothetical protein ACYDH5_16355 [Acidimicrobiales bacterium]